MTSPGTRQTFPVTDAAPYSSEVQRL